MRRRERSRDEKVEEKRRDKRGLKAKETKAEEQISLLPCIHYIHAYLLTWATQLDTATRATHSFTT